MSYDNSKVVCLFCGWRVINLSKHMEKYHRRSGKEKK